MKRLLIIDNYDSFTYNLVQLVDENFSGYYEISRNDTVDFANLHKFNGLLLSPGPGIPDEAGDLKKIIQACAASHKIFGVCLGLQAIAEVFGAQLKNLSKVYHGVKTSMNIDEDDYIFEGLPREFDAGRYHSWVVDGHFLPDILEVICTDEQGEIMALRHKQLNIRGVQFHPESVLTPLGKQIIVNFLNQL